MFPSYWTWDSGCQGAKQQHRVRTYPTWGFTHACCQLHPGVDHDAGWERLSCPHQSRTPWTHISLGEESWSYPSNTQMAIQSHTHVGLCQRCWAHIGHGIASTPRAHSSRKRMQTSNQQRYHRNWIGPGIWVYRLWCLHIRLYHMSPNS